VTADKVYVCLWFDTEDYILPRSDDALLALARMLSEEGIKATFRLVGEKARRLAARDRWDVIEAVGRHDIGFHSDLHSQHPTVAEYPFAASVGRRAKENFSGARRPAMTTWEGFSDAVLPTTDSRASVGHRSSILR